MFRDVLEYEKNISGIYEGRIYSYAATILVALLFFIVAKIPAFHCDTFAPKWSIGDSRGFQCDEWRY